MLPSRRILDDATSSTSCFCEPDHPHARKRPGYQIQLCPRALRGLWEHLGQLRDRRNLGSYRDRQSEANHYDCRPHPEPKSSCPVGPDADPRRLDLVWGPALTDPDEGDAGLLVQKDGPHGDGAHPCPAKRRTDCCLGEVPLGDVLGWEAWDAGWDAESLLTVWE